MNLYSAKQKPVDGRWRFTVENGSGTMELGYCRAYRCWTAADVNYYDSASAKKEADRLNAQYAPFESRFHTDGHSTAAEAIQCYRGYMLDLHLRFSQKPADDVQHRCASCGEWTQHAGWIAGDSQYFWWLCLAHQSRTAVEPMFKGIQKAWGS